MFSPFRCSNSFFVLCGWLKDYAKVWFSPRPTHCYRNGRQCRSALSWPRIAIRVHNSEPLWCFRLAVFWHHRSWDGPAFSTSLVWRRVFGRFYGCSLAAIRRPTTNTFQLRNENSSNRRSAKATKKIPNKAKRSIWKHLGRKSSHHCHSIHWPSFMRPTIGDSGLSWLKCHRTWKASCNSISKRYA